MSMGYGGRCQKLSEDDTEVLYLYGAYDLNHPEHPEPANRDREMDGSFTIEKSTLEISSIHNSRFSHSLRKDGTDSIGIRIADKCIRDFQKTGVFPERQACDW